MGGPAGKREWKGMMKKAKKPGVAGFVMGLAAGASVLFLSSAAMAAMPRGAAQAAAPHHAVHAVNAQKPAEPDGKLAAGAQGFVQGMAQKALNFLGDEKMSQDQKTASFRKLLQDSFDMETIGRFALGRYWRVATPAQQKEYQSLFREMVVKVYSNRFHEYRGQKFETRSVRADGDKDAIVTSFIIPAQGPEVQVDWRVRHKNGQYKVVDVIVEGVSMSVTQRSDFASVIQRGGGDVDVLLAQLRASRDRNAAAP